MFDTHEDLMKFINSELVDITASVGEEVNNLIKKNIKEIVYDPYTKYVREYQRQPERYSFYGSWVSDEGEIFQSNINEIQALIRSEGDLMSVDPDYFIHSGADPDRRDKMDEYIAEGSGYDFYIPGGKLNDNWWTKPRDYFTPTIEELDRGLFDDIAKNSLGEKFDIIII